MLPPVGGGTDLLQVRGLAVVGQSRVAVWCEVYTVVGSSLGVLMNQELLNNPLK